MPLLWGDAVKRGGPLKRRTPLKATKGLARSKPLRSTVVREPRGERVRRMEKAWRADAIRRVPRDRRRGLLLCPACGKARREEEMEAHHVVAKSRLAAYVRSLRLPREEAVELLLRLRWDKRNALAVCRRCHDRHTKAVCRIPRSCLKAMHFAFAREIGLDYVLDREYPAVRSGPSA